MDRPQAAIRFCNDTMHCMILKESFVLRIVVGTEPDLNVNASDLCVEREQIT